MKGGRKEGRVGGKEGGSRAKFTVWYAELKLGIRY